MGKSKPDRESVAMADGVSIVMAAMVSKHNGQHPKLALQATRTLAAMQGTSEYKMAQQLLALQRRENENTVST
jgi:hypothetical protein